MTRETKIGLLMGLGFIVVFAVLLLQTGPQRPVGDDLEMLIAMQGNSAGGLQQRLEANTRLPEPLMPDRRQSQASPPPREPAAEALTRAPEPWTAPLPKPRILDEKQEWGERAPGGSEMTENLTVEQNPAGPAQIAPRNVPAVDVQPTPRPQPPDQSPEPPVDPVPSDPRSSPAEHGGNADDSGVPAKYTVQKGDNLGKIAQRFYSISTEPVVEFLVRSNGDKIKNKHFVLEGQILDIPVLPVNLQVTPAGNTGVGDEEGPVRLPEPAPRAALKTLEAERQAPEALVRVAPGRESTPRPPGSQSRKSSDPDRAGASGSEDAAHRWYVIQPKDTLSSIARKELGGTQFWQNIVKMNKELRPSKLRAGEKILLPKRKGLDGVASAARSST
jgi:nucleoid-associated protein YgaU